MKIDGWEWMIVRDERRIYRWEEGKGGLWLYVDRHGDLSVGQWCHVEEDGATSARPVTSGGDVVTLDEWMEATHPTAPDGWEQIRPWAKQRSHRGPVDDCRYLNTNGEIVDEIPADEWGALVRPFAPPVTWADVPSDVYPAPLERGSCEIVRGAVVVGHLALRADGRSWVWSNGNGWAGVEPTMPAAIVALIKAAGGEG